MGRTQLHWIAAGLALTSAISFSACRRASLEPSDVASKTPLAPSAEDQEQVFSATIEHLVRSSGDTIRLDNFHATDEHVELLANMERLRVIRIDGGELTPVAAESLAAMPHLEQLHLRNIILDDAFIRALAASRTLWLINIAATDISPESVEQLAQMTQLRQLRLAFPGGSNGFASAVAKIRSLRSVHLIGMAITDEGLRELASLPALESLYLDDTEITEQGWVWLFENHPKLHVHIDQKHHDRDPQRH